MGIKNNASLKKQFDENRALQEKYQKLESVNREYDKLKKENDDVKEKNADLMKEYEQMNEALNDKLNESKMKFEDLNKRIFELEDDLKATNIRNAVIYKQYIAENEQNLKWKEMECDFNKLQKEKIDLQATMDGLIKNNASLKKQFDENRALQEKYQKLESVNR